MYSFSLEQLGTTVYAYLTPIGPTGARVKACSIGDFDLQLLSPSKVDITADTDIIVTEYEVDGVDQGTYRFEVPLPATGEGNYSLRITDSFGYKSYCVFMAYNFPPHGNTGDSTAQVELEAYNEDGTEVTSLTLAELTTHIYNPSMEDVYATVSPTLTKIENGRFLLEWDASSDEGEWFVDTVSATYFSGGQQAIWKYVEPVDYGSPTISSITMSEDELTATVVVVKGDAPYVTIKLFSHEGPLRDEDLLAGSGTSALTRAVSETGLVVVQGCDENGYPAGDPVVQAVTVMEEDEPPTGAADDNIPVAIRTMKQFAVYWACLGLDSYGKPTYDTPIVIGCRWDAVQEMFFESSTITNPKRDQVMSEARLIVDRDLVIQSVIMLGTLSDVDDEDDPKENDGAYEIRAFLKTPNFKGNKYLREVYL